jgi:WD repeat-containing protein 35
LSESASLLFELGMKEMSCFQTLIGQPLKIKKYFVLGALELEKLKEVSFSKKEDPFTKQQVFWWKENPWKGAEALHFYLLAQKQFYSGNLDSALITVMFLCIFLLIVYTLLIGKIGFVFTKL